MPDITDHALGRLLARRFGLQGAYSPALDGMIVPGFDLAGQIPEWDDGTTYWYAAVSTPALAANVSGVLLQFNLPINGTMRGIIDRIDIVNNAGANANFQLVVSPGVGATAGPAWVRNHKTTSQSVETCGQVQTGPVQNGVAAGTVLGGNQAAVYSVPASSTLRLDNMQIVAEAILGTTPIFCVWCTTPNQAMNVHYYGRVFQVPK